MPIASKHTEELPQNPKPSVELPQNNAAPIIFAAENKGTTDPQTLEIIRQQEEIREMTSRLTEHELD